MTALATLDRINDFPGLVRYLRDALEWEIPEDAAFGDLTFNWTPSEIGLDLDEPIEITQLRPLRADQPWGVFFLNFPHGKLPVTLMRRILRGLSKRKRASANAADRAAWDKDDLIFISAVGDADDRRLSFAHFQERGNDLPTLRVIGWDKDDTVRRLSHTDQVLRSKLGWLHGEGLPLNWRDAFTERPRESVRTAKEMAEALAVLARDIRDRIKLILPKENANGDLKQLFEAVKQALSRDLDTDKFADTYAQTIAYGLLSARINQVRQRDEKHEAAQATGLGPKPPLPTISAEAAGQAMPTTNPFLKELFGSFLSASGRDTKGAGLDFDELGVGEVVDLLNAADIEAVLLDFDKHKSGDDPVIHFYEGFLHAYDKALKVQRGVFYTPRPVVSFIVRSVDEVLRTEFGLADGLADTTSWDQFIATHPGTKIPSGVKGSEPFVKILDPATGTGTFLVEVIDLIHATMTRKWKAAGLGEKARIEAWNTYVPRHLLPQLYGFELMMAPYAVAHMKIGLKLADTGYRFEGLGADGKPARARVFLTNALEQARDLSMELSFMSAAMAHETSSANDAKINSGFTVIIGNPPYSLQSQNLDKASRALVEKYKYLDGVRIKEKGALQFEKIIQDDYVKFFAVAEQYASSSEAGLISYITNHSFLDGPALRGFRAQISTTFNGVFCLNLHGSASKNESSPEGVRDENVFDIQQGVAISLLLKSNKPKEAFAGDLWGSRETKYDLLNKSTIKDFAKQRLGLGRPGVLFREEIGSFPEWPSYSSINDIFPASGMGVVTARDNLAINFDEAVLLDKVSRFFSSGKSNSDLCDEFSISLKKGWNISAARKSLAEYVDISPQVREIEYRPFDTRKIFYHKSLVWGMSAPTMIHLQKGNVALMAPRSLEGGDYRHAFIVNKLAGHHVVSLKEVNFAFPLFISPTSADPHWRSNLSISFRDRLSELTSLQFNEAPRDAGIDFPSGRGDLTHTFGGRDALDWIYAVLHSPGYRTHYLDVLKSDFARVPLPVDRSLFTSLVPLGTQLVALHLLDPIAAPILAEPAVRFVNPNGVEPRLDSRSMLTRRVTAGRVYVNDACWFETVPVSVWDHWIGGYQPAQKWLKDRAAKGGKNKSEGRILTPEDQLHYRRVITALSRTTELMAEIDKVIAKHGGWPDAFRGMTD